MGAVSEPGGQPCQLGCATGTTRHTTTVLATPHTATAELVGSAGWNAGWLDELAEVTRLGREWAVVRGEDLKHGGCMAFEKRGADTR